MQGMFQDLLYTYTFLFLAFLLILSLFVQYNKHVDLSLLACCFYNMYKEYKAIEDLWHNLRCLFQGVIALNLV